MMTNAEDKILADKETAQVADSSSAPRKKVKKKWPIAIGVVAAVLIVVGAGFMVWHEQPSFCNAFCHTPMDAYYETYDQEVGVEGIDKYGNTVANTSGMMAVTHRANEDTTCIDCHVPQLGEQVSEGLAWVGGSYEVLETQAGNFVPTERSLKDLVEARGILSEQFCLNEACHTTSDRTPITSRDQLIVLTSDQERNPHMVQHDKLSCGDCHKAHRASIHQCAGCHGDSTVPEGWITPSEANQLSEGL